MQIMMLERFFKGISHIYKKSAKMKKIIIFSLLQLFSIKMTSVLDQIKQFTTIVADTGDFESMNLK
jgi:hypothetical protein